MKWVFRILLFFIKPLFKACFRLQIKGLKHIKGLKGPLLIVSNHKYFIDSFALGVAIPITTKLYPIRILGETQRFNSRGLEMIRRLGVIKLIYFIFGVLPVIRKVNLYTGLREPLKILRKDGVVFLHPEGKIIHGNGIGQFKRGAPFLAIKTGVEVLPVAFKITNSQLRKNYYIKFGQTFTLPKNISVEQGAEQMRAVVEKLFNSISTRRAIH